MFEAKHVVRSHTIEIQARPDAVFPLFTPMGEKKWVDGWDPIMHYPRSGEAMGKVPSSALVQRAKPRRSGPSWSTILKKVRQVFARHTRVASCGGGSTMLRGGWRGDPGTRDVHFYRAVRRWQPVHLRFHGRPLPRVYRLVERGDPPFPEKEMKVRAREVRLANSRATVRALFPCPYPYLSFGAAYP